MSQMILEGVKVVDLTQYLSGPTVTRLMVDFGADVVKIEQAPYGDPVRSLAFQTDRRSGYYVQQNRGKKSVCLDFDHPDGKAVLLKLIAEADVVVENYGPGVLEKRGLDYESLRETHPRLVYASISGFGRKGMYSHKTCFDLIAQAYSGMLHLTGEPDGAPMPASTSYADVMAGVHALTGISMALFHRERTGRGGHIDVAMIDTLFHAHELAIQGPSITKGKWRARRSGRFSALNAPQGVFKAPVGYVVLQVMEAQWRNFCAAMGTPELADDERFATIAGRHRNRAELNALIESWMATFPDDTAMLTQLEAHRIPCAPVLDPADALTHPYFVERRMVRTVRDPVFGELTIPGNPLRFSEQPDEPDLVAPLLGEHNGSVLRGLGYDDEAIASLVDAGVLRAGDR